MVQWSYFIYFHLSKNGLKLVSLNLRKNSYQFKKKRKTKNWHQTQSCEYDRLQKVCNTIYIFFCDYKISLLQHFFLSFSCFSLVENLWRVETTQRPRDGSRGGGIFFLKEMWCRQKKYEIPAAHDISWRTLWGLNL